MLPSEICIQAWIARCVQCLSDLILPSFSLLIPIACRRILTLPSLAVQHKTPDLTFYN